MTAWHYTTGQKFALIVADGFLRPTAVGIDAGERPVNWFSTNQVWEETANKYAMRDGKPVPGTKEGTRAAGGGLVRFGADTGRLIPWPKLAAKARMQPGTRAHLESVARQSGANPKQWLGTFKVIPVSELIVEVLNDRGKWERVQNGKPGARQGSRSLTGA